MLNDDMLINVLVIAAIVTSIVVMVSGIGLFIMGIKYSLIKRNNSLNFTGRDMTQQLFNQNGVNAEIKDSFMYVKYGNHNKRRNTYKLRPGTANRRSIGTMMEASQQAYATITRETDPRSFGLAFRLPRVVRMAGSLFGIALIGGGIYAAKEAGTLSEASGDTGFKITIGFSFMFLAVLYAEVAKAYLLRKHVPKILQNSGLNEYELKAIKSIFTGSFVYAIANAILQTLKVVIELLSKANNKNNT